jgi:hypothetical protein
VTNIEEILKIDPEFRKLLYVLASDFHWSRCRMTCEQECIEARKLLKLEGYGWSYIKDTEYRNLP